MDSYECICFVSAIGTVFVILKGCANFIFGIRILLSAYSFILFKFIDQVIYGKDMHCEKEK